MVMAAGLHRCSAQAPKCVAARNNLGVESGSVNAVDEPLHKTRLNHYSPTHKPSRRIQPLAHPRGLGIADFVALNGDFRMWHEQVHVSLMNEAPRDYPAPDSSDVADALARDGRGDHPLFASKGGGFYSSVA